MRMRFSSLAPSLLLGLGILLSTLAAVLVGDSMPLVLAGPLVLALFGGLARRAADRAAGQASPAAALLTFVYALGFGAIVALIAPARVGLVLPLLGAGVWLLITPRVRCWRRGPGTLIGE